MVDVIVAENLVKRYGDFEAVKGVSFRVRRGEVYGFLGPNGAGKTTTLGMLTTVIKPTSGDALVAGYSVSREPWKVRERIGVVFQEPTVDRELTAMENLLVHGLIHGLSRRDVERRARELLEFVGLEKFARMQVKRFSGGMVRRLEIARALINVPEVLFLDEPTTGLDPQSRAKVWDVIRALKREGVTVFLTTHYMDEAEKLCDRIAIIDRGVIVAEGSPEELKKMVGSDLVYIEFEGDPARLTARLSEYGEARLLRNNTLVLKVRDAPSLLPELLKAVEGVGVRVKSVRYSRPSLDDVFLHLTGRSLRDVEADWREALRMRIRARMR
ncbi:MAG TPA: ATP-binding cassette domain-containing protein [Pyrodictium sp.]|nr:ATP-binding cassette domain-containing protein [Pyrodictium sp.]